MLRYLKAKPCPGVGDFDTSDLPMGHRPVNSYDEPPVLPRRVQEASTRSSRISGAHVETLRGETRNGYQVTINRHNGDNSRLQVFIDHPVKETTMMDFVSLDELDNFIARNTR